MVALRHAAPSANIIAPDYSHAMEQPVKAVQRLARACDLDTFTSCFTPPTPKE